MSKLPYWRWWRYVKRRRAISPGTRPAKPWNGIIIVSGLVVLDQLAKHLLVTPDWAWHNQSRSWLIYPAIGCVVGMTLLLIEPTRIAGMLFLAGAVGNGGSELIYNTVANPFITQGDTWHVAFNVADVYLLAAVVALFYVIATRAVHRYPRRQPA